jgi:acyl-CoA thioesterase-1
MKIRVKSMILAAVLICWSATAAQAATILVFGDSISAAYGLEVSQGWVALLQNKLDKVAPQKHRVVNGSLSGETTSGGKLRLPAFLKQHRPDIVVIELGANDGLRGQPLTLMRDNLKAMIAESRAVGAEVIVLGMKIPPNYGGVYTRAFEKVYADIQVSEKVTLLPFFMAGVAGHPEMTQADGLHPVAKAQPILLENMWPLLEKALRHKNKLVINVR